MKLFPISESGSVLSQWWKQLAHFFASIFVVEDSNGTHIVIGADELVPNHAGEPLVLMGNKAGLRMRDRVSIDFTLHPQWVIYANNDALHFFNDISADVLLIKKGGDVQITLPPVFANNAAAVAAGKPAGTLYRTGADPDQVCVVH